MLRVFSGPGLARCPLNLETVAMEHEKLTRAVTGSHTDTLFLPSFCELRMVFAVVVIAQLLAFVLVLAPMSPVYSRWSNLSLVSLFIQWVALGSAAVLCMARPWLRNVPNHVAGVLSYLLLLIVTVIVSEAAYWTVQYAPLITVLQPDDHLGFLSRNLGISAVISAVALRYLYVQHQWKRQVEAEALARVDALQARIRPHFLFNSLNTIASLTRSQPAQAEEAVEDLADLFRATLGGHRDRVPLEEEIDVAKRYVHMESLRLGERLQLHWDLQDLPLQQLIPPLLLQPLLENAIYHGIEQLPEGGTVSLRGYRKNKYVILEVTNPLPPPNAKSHHDGNRMAMENIRQRLELAFGPTARMEVEERDGYYRVRLRFPEEAIT
ncbi:MAG: histidine kinase [Gammaproteobacteria bacterium]